MGAADAGATVGAAASGELEEGDTPAEGPLEDNVRLAGTGVTGVGGAWHCGGEDDTHALLRREGGPR